MKNLFYNEVQTFLKENIWFSKRLLSIHYKWDLNSLAKHYNNIYFGDSFYSLSLPFVELNYGDGNIDYKPREYFSNVGLFYNKNIDWKNKAICNFIEAIRSDVAYKYFCDSKKEWLSSKLLMRCFLAQPVEVMNLLENNIGYSFSLPLDKKKDYDIKMELNLKHGNDWSHYHAFLKNDFKDFTLVQLSKEINTAIHTYAFGYLKNDWLWDHFFDKMVDEDMVSIVMDLPSPTGEKEPFL